MENGSSGAARAVRACAASSLISLAAVAGCTTSGDDQAGGPDASDSATAKPPAPRSPTEAPETGATGTDTPCPATDAVSADALPSSLRAPGVAEGWTGKGALWVKPPTARSGGYSQAEGTYRVKYASVTVDSKGAATDAPGPPKVEAQRTDGGVERGHADVGGYASTTVGDDTPYHFWPTTIDFPSGGCWRVTERSGENSARFFIKVPPLDATP